MRDIVIDERRGNGLKSARPFGVILGRPPDFVALLAGATSLCGAPLLADRRPRIITAGPYHVITL